MAEKNNNWALNAGQGWIGSISTNWKKIKKNNYFNNWKAIDELYYLLKTEGVLIRAGVCRELSFLMRRRDHLFVIIRCRFFLVPQFESGKNTAPLQTQKKNNNNNKKMFTKMKNKKTSTIVLTCPIEFQAMT